MCSTYVCRLTAPIPAGIATIAIRGPAAESLVLGLVQLRVSSLEIGRIHYGLWELPAAETGNKDLESQQKVHEQLVVCRTQEEHIEVHCHGGRAISRAIIDSFVRDGAIEVGAADWPSDLPCL